MRIRVGVALVALASAVLPFVMPAAPADAAITHQWTMQTSGWNRSSSPTIADVTGDGINDIVIGHQDGWVRVVDVNTGANHPGWPQPAAVRDGLAVPVDGAPAVADLDNDGVNEVIVGAGSTWRNAPGGLIVFRKDGSLRCRRESLGFTPGMDNGVYSSPAIGDVDGDGYPDIVYGGWDLHIHALDRNCNELPGFPYNVEDSTWGSPALYDVDDDGRMEIFIGSDQFPGGAIDWTGGEFRALDHIDGGVRELWKRRISDVYHSSAAIGDIDGNGDMEVVVGAGNFYNHPDGRNIYAYNIADGTTQGGWPVVTGDQTNASPAIGDITNDGIADVVTGSNDGWLRAINGSGGIIWQTRMRFNASPGGPVSSPIIADMDGDGDNDVAVPNNWGFFVFHGHSGAEMAAPVTWMSSEAAGAVGNFGPYGWRLIVTAFDTPGNLSRLYSFSMPTPGTTPPWPMFRKDARHYAAPNSGGNPIPPGMCRRASNPAASPSAGSSPRGYWFLGADGGIFSFGGAPFFGSAAGQLRPGESAVGLQPSSTGNGYYILTSQGRVFTYGDAQSHGSMEGQPLNAPIIAMAPTPGNGGYWLLGRDGGVFSFGNARFFGSMGGRPLNSAIISMAATASGNGYWLLAGDGGVFSFGDAAFYGSTGGMKLAAPVISMSTSPTGGYWLVALDGGVFSFGVTFYGSLPGVGYCRPPVGLQLRATLTGRGYYVLSLDGGVFSFGDAEFRGSQPGLPLGRHAVDMAIRPA